MKKGMLALIFGAIPFINFLISKFTDFPIYLEKFFTFSARKIFSLSYFISGISLYYYFFQY